LLVWQVRAVGHGDTGAGLGEIRRGLSAIGWGFVGILAVSFARFFLRSIAWTTLIGDRVRVSDAVAATIAGDAAGNLTPLSLIVSEPAKAVYLRGVSTPHALAALTAENFFYSVSVALFVILGSIAALMAFSLPNGVRPAVLVSLALMSALLTGALWLVWREPAVASGTLSRVPGVRLDQLVAAVRAFEIRTYGLVRQSRGPLAAVAAYETLFHVLSVGEAWLTLWLITGRSSPLDALILDAVGRLVNVIFRMVPLRIGVDQVSANLMAIAIGLPDGVGVTMALVRTGRLLVWGAVGLFLLARRGLERQNARGQA
jgi:Lysylphosphatidylglycerol synthase TM region